MMTQVAAGEWAGQGIRVNAIAPGVMRTPMWDADVARGAIDNAFYEGLVPGAHRRPAGRRAAGGLPVLGRRVVRDRRVFTIDGGLTAIPAG